MSAPFQIVPGGYAFVVVFSRGERAVALAGRLLCCDTLRDPTGNQLGQIPFGTRHLHPELLTSVSSRHTGCRVRFCQHHFSLV